MIPASGYYGLLDPRACLAGADFETVNLPLPTLSCAGRWLGVWEGGALQVEYDDDDGRWLAFHGAIYNQKDLLRKLDLPENTSIVRLLLQAWARWPDDWTNRLDGLYVIAHWTGNGRDLTLRRDSSGALGLFHARTASGGIAFATHLGTLVRLPGVNRKLSRQGLHEYLRLLDIAPPNTIYEGVRAVSPGEGVMLDVQRPGIETVIQPPTFPTIEAPFDAAVAELETTLQEGIDHRLSGAAHPAAFLSGGVDSALICALASRQRPELETLTVGFDGAGFDETPVAQAIAEHLGLRHRVLRFGRDELLNALERAGRYAEQPMADPAEPATLLAFDLARQDYDVVLDGTGADDLVGAMPPRHVRVAVDYAACLPLSLRRQIAAALPHVPGLAGYAPLFDFEHPAETMMRWHGFRRPEIEALCGEPVSLEQTRFYETFGRFNNRGEHFARYSALVETMPGDRLAQAALISGLDIRFPYWATEVEAYLRGLPVSHRWRQDEPKRILRALLARQIPRNLWDLPKHGFDFPLLEFLRAQDFQVVSRYLSKDLWRQWQVVAPDLVDQYAQRFRAGETRLMFRIWALVVLAAWLEGHFD